MQDWVYNRMLRSKSILVFVKDVLAIQEGHNFIKHDYLFFFWKKQVRGL